MKRVGIGGEKRHGEEEGMEYRGKEEADGE